MRVAAALSLLVLTGASAAAAAPAPRLVEAFTEKGFDRTQPVHIAPSSAKQAADPLFHTLANQLAEALIASGFKVVTPAEPATVAVTVDYAAMHSGLPTQEHGTIGDDAYRTLIVTGFDVSDPHAPKLVWQTLMDQSGTSLDVRSTIPALIKAGTPYYGADKTTRGVNVAAWCADHVPLLGTHISVVCDKTAQRPVQRIAAQALGIRSVVSAPASGSSGGP